MIIIAAIQEEAMVVEEHHQEVVLEEEAEEMIEKGTTTTARTIATMGITQVLTMGTLHPKVKLNVQPKILRAEQKI